MQIHLFSIDTALVTPRTVVRRFRENEGDQFYNLIQENRNFLVESFPATLEETSSKELTEIFLRRRIAGWLLQKDYCFGVWENEAARLIGYVRIKNIEWDVPKAEVAFFIHHEFGNRGLMTEVLLVILRFAFEQLKLERLYVRVAQDNYPSQRLVRKCGFRREGDLRHDFRKASGELIDIMVLALTRGEYLGV